MSNIPTLGLMSVISLLSSSVFISREFPVSTVIKQYNYINTNTILMVVTIISKLMYNNQLQVALVCVIGTGTMCTVLTAYYRNQPFTSGGNGDLSVTLNKVKSKVNT